MTFKVCGTIHGDPARPVILCLSGMADAADAKRTALAFESRLHITDVAEVVPSRGIFGAFYMGVVDKT